MKELLKLLEQGYDIELRLVSKRLDVGEGRDWYERFVWKVVDGDGAVRECAWEGFGTAKECIESLIDNLSNVTKK